MGLIQAPEQLRFSYQAIIEGTQRVLHSNSNHEEGLFHVSKHREICAQKNYGVELTFWECIKINLPAFIILRFNY